MTSALNVDVVRNSAGNDTLIDGYLRRSGTVIQIQYATTMPTSHLSTTTTSQTDLPLTATITPKSASSKIKVDFFSTMGSGSASALQTILYRKIGDGAYVALTPYAATSARYYYGWMYNTQGWGPIYSTYFDTPSTTQPVTYKLAYFLNSGSTIAYLVHTYMEYGWTLTEIAA